MRLTFVIAEGERERVKRGKVAVADIGGTHARFALATVENGAVTALGEPVVLATGDFDDFESAWAGFARLNALAAVGDRSQARGAK